MFSNFGEMLEQFRGMDIANDMIDVLVIDKDLGMTGLDKGLTELFNGGSILHRINLCSGHHTVAYLRLGKVQRVLEKDHLHS